LAILSLGYNLEKLYLYICKGKPVRLFSQRLKLAVQSAYIANSPKLSAKKPPAYVGTVGNIKLTANNANNPTACDPMLLAVPTMPTACLLAQDQATKWPEGRGGRALARGPAVTEPSRTNFFNIKFTAHANTHGDCG